MRWKPSSSLSAGAPVWCRVPFFEYPKADLNPGVDSPKRETGFKSTQRRSKKGTLVECVPSACGHAEVSASAGVLIRVDSRERKLIEAWQHSAPQESRVCGPNQVLLAFLFSPIPVATTSGKG